MINIGNGLRARSFPTYLLGYLKVHFKILAKTSLFTQALSQDFVTRYYTYINATSIIENYLFDTTLFINIEKIV